MNRNLYKSSGVLTSYGDSIAREIQVQLNIIFDELQSNNGCITTNELALLLHSEVERIRLNRTNETNY